MTFATTTAEGGSLLSIALDGVENPRSTQPTSEWSFATFTPTGSGIDQS